MSNWHLIENAPKDGTWILLTGGECACEGNGRRTVVGQWTEYLNGRVSPESGRWQFAWYDGGYLGEYRNPTHWMPLPIYQPQQKQDPVYLECGE